MDEDKRKHLEFIQNIITRFNTNSFQIKGIAVAILTGLFAVYATTPKVIFILIGIPPLIIFWGINSYYLLQERKFRGIYNDITGLTNYNSVNSYEMPVKKYTKAKHRQFNYWNVVFSSTMIWFYLSLIILMTLISLLLKFKYCITFN
jgi:hypothetical protein